LVVLQVVQPLCVLLFAGFHVVMQGRGHGDRWVAAAFVVPAAFVLLHGLGMAGSGAGEHPVRLFQIWLVVDALVLAAVLKAGGPRWVEPAAASGVFLLLSIWTTQRAGPESLLAAFAAYFLFAVLHTAVPVVRLRLRPDERPGLVSQLFPAMALGLFLLPLMSGSVELPGIFWVAVLAVVVLALGFAAWVGAFLAAGAVLLVATGVVIAAFVRGGLVGMDFGESLLVVAGFAAVFVAGGWWLSRGRCPAGWGVPAQLLPSGLEFADNPRLAISGAGAVLPFLLLAMLVARAGEEQLHPLFAMTGVLGVVVLGLVRATRSDLLGAFGLLGCALVQFMWWSRGYAAMRPWPTVAWALGFHAAFTAFPFLVDRVPRGRPILWITAACSAPLHFLLIHLTLRAGDPLAVPGLVPAAFAVPSLGILAWLARRWPIEQPHRLGVLSVQGGVALLFITLVFPIQFSREWLTVAWGLEGAALVWLFRRLPHPGLRLAGLALLAVAFVRLTLNPAVLEYHARTGTRIWNWYLFAYLVVAGSQFVAARLIRPPADQLGGWDVRTVLRAFGAILLFALLNLEIADYFAGEGTLTFEFTGNFARDLSYTIGWGLFALGLVVAGILHASRGTRYAGLGLLAVTLAKLFFHDLARLDQLYRIGAFAGVAVIAIVASFLYQRFLNRSSPSHDHPAP
jgi:hypothetical protein